MGILISRFRKKRSTKELLEQIEQELEEIEDFRFSTQQHQKRWIGRLIIFSVITYLTGALLFFLYFFPSELSKQILYSLPLFIFPLIVYALKYALHWYYAYRLSQNVDQMTLLLRKRKKILKEVMATETYVVAKEILEKYDPDQIAAKQKAVQINPFGGSDASGIQTRIPDLRRRSAPVRVLPLPQMRPRGSPPPQPSAGVVPTGSAGPRPAASLPSLIRPGYNAPPGTAAPPFPRNLGVRPTGVPLPCPILPQQRGTLDRLVEFVVGDGPNNRYALICRHCQSHNGMALREEFEYIGFRCCYCYNLNPARKQRPIAPRLSTVPTKGTATDKTSEEESGNEGSVGTHEEDSEGLQSKEIVTKTTTKTSREGEEEIEKEDDPVKEDSKDDEVDLVESQFDIIESQHERVLETINSEEELTPKKDDDDVDDDSCFTTSIPFIDENDMKSSGNLIKDEDHDDDVDDPIVLEEDANRNSESDK